jgi:hypothetical protein
MQIQLKQAEITAALHQYVASTGISLAGKTVEVKFTAGRGNTGLSADISIEDSAIPGVELAPSADAVKPTLSVVAAPAAPAATPAEAPKAPGASLFN